MTAMTEEKRVVFSNIEREQRTTRERILRAAFSFYASPRFSNLSLREIAEKASITKPAIFRHFKNKEALVVAMRQYFFDTVAAEFDTEPVCSDIRTFYAHVQVLMQEHPEFCFYLFYQLVSSREFEAEAYDAFVVKDNNRSWQDVLSSDGESVVILDKTRYYKMSFVVGSLLFFIAVRQLGRDENVLHLTDSEFYSMLAKVMESGLSLDGINRERRRELDEGVRLVCKAMPQENPMFSALSQSIRKNGFPKMTMKGVSSELGISASSLYTHFGGKGEMVDTLVKKELASCLDSIVEAVCVTDKVEEQLYISMRIVMTWYILRPSLVAVLAWWHMKGALFGECAYRSLENINNLVPNTAGFPVTVRLLSEWSQMLVTTIFGQAMGQGTKNLTTEDCETAVDVFFDYIQQGVGADNE